MPSFLLLASQARIFTAGEDIQAPQGFLHHPRVFPIILNDIFKLFNPIKEDGMQIV
jgi:hypothetical protein